MLALPAGWRIAGLIALTAAVSAAPAVDAAAVHEGPRPLPPTFVRLELGAFPRPASQACAGRTHLVRARPPDGLWRAAATARPGTTILLDPGSYRGAPADSNAVTLSSGHVCVRTPSGRAILAPRSPDQHYGLVISGNGTVIDRLTVRGFSSSVSLTRPGGRTLRGITLERVDVERPSGRLRDGIVAYDDHRRAPGRPPTVDGLLVLDSRVEGTDLGISCNFGPCAHWWIERTVVHPRKASQDSGADAFAIEDGRQIVVLDSTFTGAAADGIDTKATDVVVFGAQVLNVARNGIKLWHGGDVIDSVLDGSGADAALVGDQPARYRYLHVLVTRHGKPGQSAYVGAWLYDHRVAGLRLELVNDIFYGNAPGGFFVPASARLSIRHTIFGDRGKLLDFSDGTTLTTAQTGQLERTGRGRRIIVANPRIGPRWTPQPGSPAIDAAQPVSGLTRDLFGNPRIQGRAPDIGPVEAPAR